MKISNKLETNMQRFEKPPRPDINFDVVDMRLLRWRDGMPAIHSSTVSTKDDTLLRILQSFGSIKPEAECLIRHTNLPSCTCHTAR